MKQAHTTEKTIPPEAVSGATFCINCDEVICSCITHLDYQRSYTIIDGEVYIIKKQGGPTLCV